MIHGYHVIMPMYGFWLPNDPRGSWSDFVRQWELVAYGKATRGIERKELTESEQRQREAAKQRLLYPAVAVDGFQAQQIALAFGQKAHSCNYSIWACSVLPNHSHLIIARHSYRVERIVNQLKGASTRRLLDEGMHPLSEFASDGRVPRMWASGEWKVYLDSEEAIESAIDYVEQNPIKEGKPRQKWSFVTPFYGVPSGGWTTYH